MDWKHVDIRSTQQHQVSGKYFAKGKSRKIKAGRDDSEP